MYGKRLRYVCVAEGAYCPLGRARGSSAQDQAGGAWGHGRAGAIAALYMSSKTTSEATVLACSWMAAKTSSRSVKALN